MRRAWYVTTKELRQNRRDPLATLFTVFLPVIFTVVLGLVIGSQDDGRLPLAIADEDGSILSQQLIARLEDSPLLELRAMDAGQVDDAVHDHEAAAGLVIPAGFADDIARGDTATLTFVRIETATGAQSIWEAVQNAISQTNTVLLASRAAASKAAELAGIPATDTRLASAEALVEAQLADPVVTADLTASGAGAEVQAQGFEQSSPGMIVNFVLFGLLGVTTTTVLERRQGLLRRLNVAGLRAYEIVGGKMLAMFLLTFLQQLLLVVVGQFALGVHYFNSPLALLLTMVSLSILAAAFGMLISALFRSEQPVIATTVIASMMMAALGGAWFPLEVTGAGFSRVAHVLPMAWVIDSFHGIILKSWGVGDILLPLAILWAWIVALFGLAVWRYRPD
jgi:ABC-2 type transport system permease protein